MFTNQMDAIANMRQLVVRQPDLAGSVEAVLDAVHTYESLVRGGNSGEVVATARVNAEQSISVLMDTLETKDRELFPQPGMSIMPEAHVRRRAIYSMTENLVVLQRFISC